MRALPLRLPSNCQFNQGAAKVPLPASLHRLDLEPPSKEMGLDGTNERRGWRRLGREAALAAGGLLVDGRLGGC